MTRQNLNPLAVLCCGAFLGAWLHAVTAPIGRSALAQQGKATPDPNQLMAELETIKGKLPDQAHAMQDVGYHFSNLWFAGQHENWDLANFYWSETRSHLQWAVRIIPKRKNSVGQEIDLVAILEGFENGPLKHLQEAITARDKQAFDKNYRTSLETCYDCHTASEKPFLRLQIPDRPETPIMNFDPKASLPR